MRIDMSLHTSIHMSMRTHHAGDDVIVLEHGDRRDVVILVMAY